MYMIKSIAFLTVFLFCVYGCGYDTTFMDDPGAPLEVGFRLAPGAAPAQSSITRIEVAVSTPDAVEPQVFSITNINQGERTARGMIRLPVADSVTLSARAFDGNCPVLSGLLENIRVTSDISGPMIITLAPIQTVIGIRAVQDQLSVGSRYDLEVYVEDAPDLVSLTCELGFDENLLEPMEVVPGDFFGGDVLFIQDSEFPRRERNRLAMGITLKRGAAGVCGSGVVFRVAFRAAGSGDASVTLLENVTMVNSAFEQIEDSSRIRIEPGPSVKIE